MKLIFFYISIIIIISMGIVHAPPPQTNTNLNIGIDIRYPQYETIRVNTTFNFHTHIFNKTDGLILTNSSTSCLIHIYSPTGSHILQDDLNFNNNGFDFELPIQGNNFSQYGIHSWMIQCNTSEIGGFAAGVFDVTYSGVELKTSQSILYSTLIIILVLLFIATFFGIGMLPDDNEKSVDGELLSISKLKYLRSVLWFVEWLFIVAILFMTSNIAFAYLPGQMFAKLLFKLFQITLSLTLPIVVIWFIWIFLRIHNDKQLQKLMDRGMHGNQL